MICTVSTVKDTRPNVEEFVEENLQAGADHMFVFLEHDPDGQLEMLRQHPDVTPVLIDESYYHGRRPDIVTRRQIINANLVNCLLAALPTDTWLAHIDGDECLEVDKEHLTRLEPEVRCVRLKVLEAVSTEHGSRSGRLFKRKLGKAELQELHEAGILAAADNRAYLNGHLIGKAVMRPALDLHVGIHRVRRRGGDQMPHLKSPDFAVLHYDCISAESFIAKWTARVRAVDSVFLRDERRQVFDSVARCLAEDVPEEERQERLLATYRELGEDRVEELSARGLLVTPRFHDQADTRRPFDPQEREDVRTLLQILVEADKAALYPGAEPHQVIDLMGAVATRVEAARPDLASDVRRAVTSGEKALAEAPSPG